MLKQCLAIVAHDSGQATTLVRATAHSVAPDLSSPLPSLRWPAVESPQLTSAQPETPGADRFASKATATRCQTQPATICGCPRRTAASGRPIPNDATARAPRHRRLSCLAHALKELTGDQQRLDPWRKQRYAFAHRGGTFLIEAHPPTPVALGPALYSVYLVGTGLWYVGPTEKTLGPPYRRESSLGRVCPTGTVDSRDRLPMHRAARPGGGDHDWTENHHMKACG
jgi:hypothetical protein